MDEDDDDAFATGMGVEIDNGRASVGRESARMDAEQYIPVVLPNESFKRSINAGVAGGAPFGNL